MQNKKALRNRKISNGCRFTPSQKQQNYSSRSFLTVFSMLYRRTAQTPFPTCISLIVNTHTFSHFLLTLWASGLSNLIAQVADTVTNLQIQQHQIHHLRPGIVISNRWSQRELCFTRNCSLSLKRRYLLHCI